VIGTKWGGEAIRWAAVTWQNIKSRFEAAPAGLVLARWVGPDGVRSLLQTHT
jgi:hypothetical protein